MVNATVPGLACSAALLAVVATNMTSRVAAGAGEPLPVAVIMAGPAVADVMVTPSVSPAAFAFTGLPAMVPRLAAKLTAEPDAGTPAFFQLIETAVAVFRGMSMVVAGATSVGVVNAKLALLTVIVCVALVPAAVAVSTSFPVLVPVRTTATWPELLVVPEAGVTVFPEVTVTVIPCSAAPAESLTLNVSGVLALNASELLPLMVTVVPVTSTVLVVVAESAVTVALIGIVRLALLLPRLSLAVTTPFESDTPLALILLTNAVSATGVENVTVLPLTVCLAASNTTAVRSTVAAPEEGICVVLASSWIVAATAVPGAGTVGIGTVGIACPAPQPASTANAAARKSEAENLEMSPPKIF